MTIPLSQARVIGLTGGMGSGKSLVSSILAARGFHIIDADVLTRSVHQNPLICQKLAETFGSSVIQTDPEIRVHRRELARIAFKSRENTAKLNEIMMPALCSELNKQLHNLSGRIIVDAPLLFEAGWDRFVDTTVTVICPLSLRIQRIQKRDGLPVDQILARIHAQTSEELRIRKTGYILYNVGTLDFLRTQVERMF